MDGISNLLGSREIWLEVGGQTFELSTLTLSDLARRERWILSRKPRLSSVAIPSDLPSVAKEQILQDARRESTYGNFAEGDVVDRFNQSPRGRCVTLWIALRARHPAIDLPAATEIVANLIEQGREAELQDALEEVTESRILPTLRNADGDTSGDGEPSTDDGRRRRTIPWAYAFERLLQESHLGPEEIGRLTFYRALVLLGRFCPEHVTIRRRSS